MKQPLFTGVATALVTPFREGRVDIDTFSRLLELQYAGGVSAVVVCGTTGESATLSDDEHIALVKDCVDYVAGRVPVMYYMESNFMQDLMLDEFRKVGDAIGNHVPIRGDARKKGDKFARIEAMQPLFERGLVVFNEAEKDSPGMQVLIDQLLMFERGSRAHDDAPDALESAIWMLSQRNRSANKQYWTVPRTLRRF